MFRLRKFEDRLEEISQTRLENHEGRYEGQTTARKRRGAFLLTNREFSLTSTVECRLSGCYVVCLTAGDDLRILYNGTSSKLKDAPIY